MYPIFTTEKKYYKISVFLIKKVNVTKLDLVLHFLSWLLESPLSELHQQYGQEELGPNRSHPALPRTIAVKPDVLNLLHII